MDHAKNHFHKFLLLWAGQLISAVGSGLTSFGLSVYVFRETGSASAMALVTLLAFVPALLFSIPAGVLADRYDRRLLMVLGDGLSATGLLWILFCMGNGGVALWQICVGVTISAVFSSLLEPSYKATVTDLLTPEQYTKACGLVGIAGSAKYLISPILAGFLLAVSDIKLLLILDIATFFVTVTATLVVRSRIVSKKSEQPQPFLSELKDGWYAISQNRGILVLVLAFSDSITLGITETICASGMLVSSIWIGCLPIQKGYAKLLSIALFCAGIFMALFGLRENILWLCIFGFLFFAALPFVNSAIDYLLRTNIENKLQGRAWGLIGVISQLGYVAAYGCSGILTDALGKALGIGVGRGAGLLILIAGVCLAVTALLLYQMKSIGQLEQRGDL